MWRTSNAFTQGECFRVSMSFMMWKYQVKYLLPAEHGLLPTLGERWGQFHNSPSYFTYFLNPTIFSVSTVNLSFDEPQSFDDLHRLWFILYKERNLILTEKTKMRKNMTPITATDEQRYFKVKRSMAAIKHVLSERQKINNILNKKELPTPVV